MDDFVPDVDNSSLVIGDEEKMKSEKNDKEISNEDKKLIVDQVADKISENFTSNYNEAFNINEEYYVGIEDDSFEYTDKYYSSKDESYFEEIKKKQIENIKKVIKGTDVTIHISEIITDDELSTANELTKYINSELYIANDDNLNKLIEYSKQSELYYTETIHLSD